MYGIYWADFKAGPILAFFALLIIYFILDFYFPYWFVCFFDSYWNFYQPLPTIWDGFRVMRILSSFRRNLAVYNPGTPNGHVW